MTHSDDPRPTSESSKWIPIAVSPPSIDSSFSHDQDGLPDLRKIIEEVLAIHQEASAGAPDSLPIRIDSLAPLIPEPECLRLLIPADLFESLELTFTERGLKIERLDQIVDAFDPPSVESVGQDPLVSPEPDTPDPPVVPDRAPSPKVEIPPETP